MASGDYISLERSSLYRGLKQLYDNASGMDNHPMMLISHDDARLSWHGAISIERTPTYSRPWRIHFNDRALVHPVLKDRAATQAGIRLAFHSSTGSIAGKILLLPENQKLDLFVDGCYVDTCLLYTSPSPRDKRQSRMPSSA